MKKRKMPLEALLQYFDDIQLMSLDLKCLSYSQYIIFEVSDLISSFYRNSDKIISVNPKFRCKCFLMVCNKISGEGKIYCILVIKS